MNDTHLTFRGKALDPWTAILDIALVLLILRILILLISPFNLGPDEAQYWSWSTQPDFGYFTKPPMIAWLIGGSTFIFGESEWAIRLTSPILHTLTTLMIYKIGALLYSPRIGFWSALTFATLPSVFFSSGLISTDTPLLFFWSTALYAFIRFERDGEMKWAALMGAAIGLGLMSKYAMVYFILCLALYLIGTRHARALLASPRLYLAFGIAGLVVLPNLIWNMNSGFATFTHTAANANWQGDMFNPDRMFDFLLGQMGVFGPILFPALLIGAWLAIRSKAGAADRMLLFFSLPILVIATTQGFLSRANANWAATTYIAATLFTVAFIARSTRPGFLKGSLGLHLALAAWFYMLIGVPGAIEATGASNAFKRVRGWDEIGATVVARSEDAPYTAIMGDNRLITAELLYYARPRTVAIAYWDADLHPTHHYELTIPLQVSQGGRVLLVSRSANPKGLFEHFSSTQFLETVEVVTGKGKSQKVHLFDLTGYKGRGHD
jgi:4-amino-4-deoxy-L-arabinose transferase-like glycosyltransferase